MVVANGSLFLYIYIYASIHSLIYMNWDRNRESDGLLHKLQDRCLLFVGEEMNALTRSVAFLSGGYFYIVFFMTGITVRTKKPKARST